MTKKEAKKIIAKYEEQGEWEAEDASFGDGSYIIGYNIVFDSKKEAEEFILAIKTLTK